MCGILAVLNFDPEDQLHVPLVQQMTDTMVNRGPDHQGYWAKGPVGLGHCRLAIIDLSPAGNQPMTNEDGTLWITYNGEIYNFLELRQVLENKGHTFRSHTDTEVILHSYEEWGKECLSHFNGMWAFALWDQKERGLFVARDRLGVKPLVYTYNNPKRFICASEIKGIISDPTVPRDIDPEALHHYFSLMTIPAPFTIYKNIHKLLPGHYLWVKDGSIEDQVYWNLPINGEIHQSQEEILDQLDVFLQDSVNRRMISDVPLGAFLSGGVDSSLVSALAVKFLKHTPFYTFTVRFKGQEEYDESLWAQQVATHLNTNHHEIELSFDFIKTLPYLVRIFDEPFAISSAVALYEMAKEVSKHIKVVLTGDGGDEVFGGYPWRHSLLDQYLDWLNFWPLKKLHKNNESEPSPPVRWKTTHGKIRMKQILDGLQYDDHTLRRWMYLQSLYCFNEIEKRELYSSEWFQHLDRAKTDHLLVTHIPKKAPNRLARWIAFDLQTTVADEMLSKVDKATMACGLEARVPLLDYRLVEYAMNLPARMKVKGREGKRILRWLGKRYLPEQILIRPKHGFNMPLNAWFRNKLWNFANDILSESSLRAAGYFNPKTIQEILRHHCQDPKNDLSNPIYALICFELWRRG
jgi:asparagine synthase (glutamine-hydrolysing)